MKRTKIIGSLIIITLSLLVFSGSGFAQISQASNGTNADFIFLTPGHERAIGFDLHTNIFNDMDAYHAAFIMTLGEGTFSARTATNSVTDQEVVFITTGLIGLTPVFSWAYSFGSTSVSVEVPAIGFGLLLTFIGYGPNDPVAMGSVYSLYQF